MTANTNDTEYNNVISALTLNTTQDGTVSIQRLAETAVVSKRYFNTKDYWLTITKDDINDAILNLKLAGSADEDDVRGYAVDSSKCGGESAAHLMRFILSKCTVENDPLSTGDAFAPMDVANTALELAFGDADIIIQENIQDAYDSDEGTLEQMIGGLTASSITAVDATAGMLDNVYTYTQDSSDLEDDHTAMTCEIDVVGGGDMGTLFNQISALCGDSETSIGTTRTASNDPADKFVVGDLLCLSSTSSFKYSKSISVGSGGTAEDPTDAQVETQLDTSYAAWANKDVRTNTVDTAGSTNTLYSNGKIFLQVIA